MGSFFSRWINSNQKKHELHVQHNESILEKADSMQEVLDGIYMGSAAASENLALLKQHHITHILAIGWDLKKHFENEFKYLLLNGIEDRPGFLIIKVFEQCFQFIDDALSNNNNNNNKNIYSPHFKPHKRKGNVFVHCHKGLSRSATVIIAYEMYKKKLKFTDVLNTIREQRSFIMPNIGFQVQLQAFEEKNYSLNMNDYADLNVMSRISALLPDMLLQIKKNVRLYELEKEDEVNTQDLFGLTMYFHQVLLLHEDQLLNENDFQILQQAIFHLRRIQVEFIKIPTSLARFDKMFHVTNNNLNISYHCHNNNKDNGDTYDNEKNSNYCEQIPTITK